MREAWVQSLGREDPLEKEMATHSSTLAWKIPWIPGRLQPMGSQRVGHDWVTSLSFLLIRYGGCVFLNFYRSRVDFQRCVSYKCTHTGFQCRYKEGDPKSLGEVVSLSSRACCLKFCNPQSILRWPFCGGVFLYSNSAHEGPTGHTFWCLWLTSCAPLPVSCPAGRRHGPRQHRGSQPPPPSPPGTSPPLAHGWPFLSPPVSMSPSTGFQGHWVFGGTPRTDPGWVQVEWKKSTGPRAVR